MFIIDFFQLKDKSVSSNNQALSVTIPSCSVGLAYLWETSPVLQMEGLPLYANDSFGLPGAPWIKEITSK